jgi:hypothetical protein
MVILSEAGGHPCLVKHRLCLVKSELWIRFFKNQAASLPHVTRWRIHFSVPPWQLGQTRSGLPGVKGRSGQANAGFPEVVSGVAVPQGRYSSLFDLTTLQHTMCELEITCPYTRRYVQGMHVRTNMGSPVVAAPVLNKRRS